MAGKKRLRKIQLAAEVTPGTPVTTATAVWLGEGTLEDTSVHEFPPEDVGLMGGRDRSYTPQTGGLLTMDAVPATFEQIDYVLNAGITYAAGTRDGVAADGYIRTHAFPTTSQYVLGGTGTPKTYTLQGGDDQQGEYAPFGFVSEYEMTGKAGESWMISSKWPTRQIVKQALTGSIALVTPEEMLFGKTKLYIDAVGGTLGSTQVSQTLLEASLKVKTGWEAYFTADGRLDFVSIEQQGEPQMEITLDLTYRHNASAVAEKDAWIARTSRQIQLLIEGTTFANAGTVYSKKTHVINLAGRYEKFNSMEDMDGTDIVKCTFRARYNSTAALFASHINVVDLSALP